MLYNVDSTLSGKINSRVVSEQLKASCVDGFSVRNTISGTVSFLKNET